MHLPQKDLASIRFLLLLYGVHSKPPPFANSFVINYYFQRVGY